MAGALQLPTLSQQYRLDTAGFDKGARHVQDGTKKMAGAVDGVRRVAKLAAAALTVGLGATIFKQSIDEARESIRVGRQTQAVLKSTGGVAKVSAGQVGDLANHLSGLAGVDDEVIQQGENVLLTFTNVRNEVGAGNDIFNQATAAALDMSSALGTDLQGAIIQVGKSLNDPIKGVTALQRVGVSFTQQQKDQIATLEKSGHSLEAQKLVLGELQREFAGAAAANADPLKKLQVTWKNVEEEIGLRAMPTLNRVADFLNRNLPKALDWVTLKVAELWVGWKLATQNVSPLGIAGELGKIAHLSFTKALEILHYIIEHKDTFETAGAGLATFATSMLALNKAGKGIAAISSLSTALEGLGALGPIGWIAAVVLAIGAAGFIAYQKFKPFHDAVDSVGRAIRDLVSGPAKDLLNWFSGLKDTFDKGGLGGVISSLFDSWKGRWAEFGGWLTGTAIPQVQSWVADLASTFWGWITDAIASLPGHLADWLSSLGDWITGTALPWIGDRMKSLIPAMFSWIVDTAAAFPGHLIQINTAIGAWILGTLEPWLIEKGAAFVGAILGWIVQTAVDMPGKFLTLVAVTSTWVYGTMIPALVRFGADMGAKLISWIADEVPKIPGQLFRLMQAVWDWVYNHGVPGLVDAGRTLATGIFHGLATAIEAAPQALLNVAKAIAHGVITIINDLLPNSIDLGWFGSVDLPDNPIPNNFHTGGVVNQVPRGQEMPAVMLGGEGVLQMGTVDSIVRDITGRATPTAAFSAGAPRATDTSVPTYHVEHWGDEISVYPEKSTMDVDDLESLQRRQRLRTKALPVRT